MKVCKVNMKVRERVFSLGGYDEEQAMLVAQALMQYTLALKDFGFDLDTQEFGLGIGFVEEEE